MANVVITQLGPLFTIEEVKDYLRVDHGDDDTLIAAHMEAAVAAVLQYCNLSIVPPGKEAAFKAAALMTVGRLYDTAGTNETAIPPAGIRLIEPHRWLRV